MQVESFGLSFVYEFMESGITANYKQFFPQEGAVSLFASSEMQMLEQGQIQTYEAEIELHCYEQEDNV